jgi:hypothetical protein
MTQGRARRIRNQQLFCNFEEEGSKNLPEIKLDVDFGADRLRRMQIIIDFC